MNGRYTHVMAFFLGAAVITPLAMSLCPAKEVEVPRPLTDEERYSVAREVLAKMVEDRYVAVHTKARADLNLEKQ